MNTVNDRIQSLLDQFVAEGKEMGVQVAAYHHGRLLVNAFAGVARPDTDRQVNDKTLFPVFSTTKGIAATVIHRLAERGLLRYDDPICKVWPEFAAEGKDRITLRQGMNHSAGLPYMPLGIGYREMSDWNGMCSAIAAMKPLWAPGSKTEYHAITYSWIVGEVACRVTGKSFPQLVQEEICEPLNIDTLFVGLPAELEDEVAILKAYEPIPTPPPPGQTESIPHWIGQLHTMMNRSDSRRACIPASNGIMNALAIAKHYAALLPGGVEGVELLPPERVRLATEAEIPPGQEEVKRWALGYQLGGPLSVYGGHSAFGHGGHGGSTGFADPEAGLAFGLTKNLYVQESTKDLVVREIRQALNRKV